MNLVYIYGPPGVGKLTVATELAKRTGYRLFHNHVSIAAIEGVFDYGTPTFWRLVHSIREQVFEAAAQDDIDLVYTGIYEHPKDESLVARRLALVEDNGGRVCLVRLFCDPSLLEQRIASPSRRVIAKMTDVEQLRREMKERDYFSPIPERFSLTLDTTELSPQDAAARIIEHYGLPATRS
jgi:predicted kinase